MLNNKTNFAIKIMFSTLNRYKNYYRVIINFKLVVKRGQTRHNFVRS